LNLELRLLERHQRVCQSIPAPRAIATRIPHARGPFGIDDEAVDRWWHASMP
jgi:hypothetical protein